MSSPRTHRPTLVSGQPAVPGTGSHRILADMEGRSGRAAAAGESAATARRRPWPWRWLLAAALVTTLLLASLAVLRTTPGTDAEPSVAASPFAPLAVDPLTPVEQPRGAAMIVDDPPSLPASTATPVAAAGNDAGAGSSVPARTGGADAATRRKASRPSTASRQAPRQAEDADLLSTLLGIIKQKDAPAVPQQYESMDTLIAEIQSRDRRERAESDAVFDSMNRRSAASTSDSSVQAQLRRCPAANTLKGVDCRRRICAELAGKDAACPAQ